MRHSEGVPSVAIWQSRMRRRVGGVVERGGLENRCGCKPTGGSNPSPSATVLVQNQLAHCQTRNTVTLAHWLSGTKCCECNSGQVGECCESVEFSDLSLIRTLDHCYTCPLAVCVRSVASVTVVEFNSVASWLLSPRTREFAGVHAPFADRTCSHARVTRP